ncbi:MAG: transporter ATP-binding protein [Sphingobacteriales bacterium]|nr:transporter ATP-binding protein [Sphingobacteriales bacterium]
MSKVIRVENLSKQYRLGEVGTGSLSHDINRLWHKARGKEDPYSKVGEENKRETKGNSDYVWALKDINFDIEQGDRVGIIGRNGAGKSTLLKILSRTTSPTCGSVKIKGKVASLLEVGTGFHPDLSGRDNIFLNGAILGMSKREVKRRFDEIVDFSGVERYIDTPVKRYSSGMYVRLAFAVAAHLESDILIVDEVLAVGDAEFQKKSLGKMNQVSEEKGKTILLVSHNMQAILNLCSSSILLNNGGVAGIGDTLDIITKYLADKSSGNIFKKEVDNSKIIQLTRSEIKICDFKKLIIEIEIESEAERECSIDMRITDRLQLPFAFGSIGSLNYDEKCHLRKGENRYSLTINLANFALGVYYISLDLTNPNIEYYDRVENCLQFEVIKDPSHENKRYVMQNWNYGSYHLKINE